MNKFLSTLSLLLIISAPVMAGDYGKVITEKTTPGVISEERAIPTNNESNQDVTQPEVNQGKYNAAEEEGLKTQEALIQEDLKRKQEQPVVR